MGTSSNETADTMDLGPCSECGRKNPFDARFCGGCGFQFQGGDDDGAEENVADPLIGRVIADRYRIIELLGRGGMGVVYKVEHIHIGKFMAMKLLHGELARDRNTVKRFQREAEAISRLSHPNSVQVFDFGRSEGLMYLVMEYLEGRDLGQVIRDEGHLDFQRVARLASQVCASVAQAHAEGVVHRDLKPENVMIIPARQGSNEIAKVLDFGLAKLRDQMGNVTVTRAGHIVGTPYYMAPEQMRQQPMDRRTDIFALGIVLWEMLAGRRLFQGETDADTVRNVARCEVPSLRHYNEHVPPPVDQLLQPMLAQDPATRLPSDTPTVEALDALLRRIDPDVGHKDVALVVGLHLHQKKREAPKEDLELDIEVMGLADLFQDELSAFVASVADASGGSDALDPNDFALGIELEGADHIPFEDAQYHRLRALLDALIAHYPRLSHDTVTGHEHIAPGRKTDPGPAFDWTRL